MAEIAVNQASNGAFDALDCLELSLYGMQMETEMYKTLVDYKDTMRFEGEFLSPQFDHEKMETFACLAWNYLKACYITRENMLGIYQTQKNDEHYEIAVQGILEYQDKTAELLDVLNARIDGVTQERAKQQEEVRQVENRYLLKAVKSIYNNGGNYVKKDNAVYFWKYREDSFEKIAKFGIFGKLAGEGNQLIKRAEDGTETVIYQGSGYDKIFIHNGRFYLTGSEPSSYGFYMSNVYSIDMDGKDRKDYGPGKILDLDEENGVLICMSVDYKDSLYLIYCEDGSRTELCEYAEYLGREGQYAYYENKAENNNLLIERVALDGSQTETVLEIPGYAQQYGLEEGASIIASQIYNGYLYFNYGYIAGTARLYQEGVIGRVRLDGSGYQVIAGTGVRKNETFYVYANDSGEVFINIRDLYGGNYRIALKDLSITSVETISATMGEIFCEGGAAYFYPEANNVLVQIVKDDRLDNASGMGETYFQVRDAQIVDGYIYYITEYSVHNPEGDMGWRYSYERKETTLYRRPLNGDQIEVIYQY